MSSPEFTQEQIDYLYLKSQHIASVANFIAFTTPNVKNQLILDRVLEETKLLLYLVEVLHYGMRI